ATYCASAVRVALACEDVDLADALLESLSMPGPRQTLPPISARAALANSRGDLRAAADLYAEAAAGGARFGFVWEEAWALEGGGRCRGQRGDREVAAPLLAAAAERFDRLGVRRPPDGP